MASAEKKYIEVETVVKEKKEDGIILTLTPEEAQYLRWRLGWDPTGEVLTTSGKELNLGIFKALKHVTATSRHFDYKEMW